MGVTSVKAVREPQSPDRRRISGLVNLLLAFDLISRL